MSGVGQANGFDGKLSQTSNCEFNHREQRNFNVTTVLADGQNFDHGENLICQGLHHCFHSEYHLAQRHFIASEIAKAELRSTEIEATKAASLSWNSDIELLLDIL
jgi:hypothetical protein